MSEYIIEVNGLAKEFKVPLKQEGFRSSLKSLFNRQYKQVVGVSGLDLRIRRGEIRGLLGPNGAGKSTTIKMLSGILHPSAGEVNILGFTPWLQREVYVRHIGVVFGQKSQLIWDLPAIDTFSLIQEMYKIPMTRYRESVEYFKSLLQIEEVVYKPVRQLSLGERMKCELVCALLHEPELIFLDEPTIGLDLISKETIRSFIKKLNQEKQTTFIVTTHDLEDVENLCHNVSIINNGALVFDDSLMQLQNYFANRKVIEVTFQSMVDDRLLQDFEVIETDWQSAKIEVDTREISIREHVSRIFDSLPVQDININNIPIENVIKEIYRKKITP
jgi:ABC-2 type transport system ATP-binding protein